MGFGMFDVTNFIKGGKDHAGSSDPNNPWFGGGSGNLFANQIYDRSLSTWDDANREIRQGRASAPRPDAAGFMPYQRAGMDEWARNLFARGSSSASARGMNMPQNYGAIVGSALTRALPNLFAIQNENQLLPEQLVQQRVSTRMMPLKALEPMLHAGQFSRGAGIGYNNMNTANSNYWDMANKIGSFWGSAGAGKLAG